MSTDVLLYGRDVSLLETRQLLLENHGYPTSATTELADVERILSQENVKLLILGHSLTLEDTGRVLAISQSLRPSIKYLYLINWQSSQCPESCVETFDVSKGPAQFIARVQRMLSPPPIVASKGIQAVPDATHKRQQPVLNRPDRSAVIAR
jgi:hypothetical protein